MSGFDVGMRSQQFGAQVNQAYDSMATNVRQGANQMLTQGFQQGFQNLMAQRQQEMQMMQAQSSLRLQEAETQAQFHRNKIAAMMEIDMLDQSKAQTEAMKVDAETRRFALERDKKLFDQQQGSQTVDSALQMYKTLGPEFWLSKGKDFDPATGFVDVPPDEAKKRLQMIGKMSAEGRYQAQEDRRKDEFLLRALKEQADQTGDTSKLEAFSSEMAKKYGGVDHETLDKQLADIKKNVEARKQVGEVVSKFNVMIGGTPIYYPQDADAIGRSLVSRRGSIIAKWRQSDPKVKDWSDDKIMDMVYGILRDPTDPRREALAAALIQSQGN